MGSPMLAPLHLLPLPVLLQHLHLHQINTNLQLLKLHFLLHQINNSHTKSTNTDHHCYRQVPSLCSPYNKWGNQSANTNDEDTIPIQIQMAALIKVASCLPPQLNLWMLHRQPPSLYHLGSTGERYFESCYLPLFMCRQMKSYHCSVNCYARTQTLCNKKKYQNFQGLCTRNQYVAQTCPSACAACWQFYFRCRKLLNKRTRCLAMISMLESGKYTQFISPSCLCLCSKLMLSWQLKLKIGSWSVLMLELDVELRVASRLKSRDCLLVIMRLRLRKIGQVCIALDWSELHWIALRCITLQVFNKVS